MTITEARELSPPYGFALTVLPEFWVSLFVATSLLRLVSGVVLRPGCCYHCTAAAAALLPERMPASYGEAAVLKSYACMFFRVFSVFALERRYDLGVLAWRSSVTCRADDL